MKKRLLGLGCILLLVGCAGGFRPVAARPQITEPKILFRFNSDQVDSAQVALIQQEAKLLGQYKEITLILEGHTDAVGAADYNLELGDRRARNVLVKLVEAGVDPKRIIVVSRGKEHPQESNRTQPGRDKNRRVEFVVRQ